jgi:hypothetical protein
MTTDGKDDWLYERRGSAMNVGMGWYVVQKNSRAIEGPSGSRVKHGGKPMTIRSFSGLGLATCIAVTGMILFGAGTGTTYAQAQETGSQPSKVEITIKDRQHGYQTVGMTHPSHDTIIVVRNQDTVTHGFASRLFRDIDVQVENGKEVWGKNFRSFHVEPGQVMTLHFPTAPMKLGIHGPVESMRHAIWCDIHPEVRGELYVVETRGDLGGR